MAEWAVLPLLSVLAHHGDPADPLLLEWLKRALDSVTGLGPVALVVILVGMVLAVPAAVLAVYWRLRPRNES